MQDVGYTFCVQQSWGVPADVLSRIHLTSCYSGHSELIGHITVSIMGTEAQ